MRTSSEDCRIGSWLIAGGVALLLGGAGQTVNAAEGKANSSRPNILYILCDDLGYGDVRCLNPQGKIATPNLDRLAAEGMKFTDAHSGSAVCTPTRYGVITGRYAWRSKLQNFVLGGLSPRLIEQDRLTVANLLKRHGYHTACIGKWHLGMDFVVLPGKEVTELSIETPEQVHNVDFTQPIKNGPTTVGFDEYFGISASLDMVPYVYIRNDRVTAVPTVDKSFAMMPDRKAGTTRLGPAAEDFEATDVLPEFTRQTIALIERQAAAARDGKPFFLYLPLNSPHTPIVPTREWLGKSGLNPYADFVMQTDWSIGQVLDALDKHDLAENTLIIVTSDNGCSPRAEFPELLAKNHNPSHVFRGTKADIFDGGHRVPFIVRWPGVAKAGSESDQLTCLTDFMATCAEIVGAKLPDNAGEDSVSLLPALRGEAKTPLREAVVHHSINGSFAIRQGEWKLELCPGSGGWSAPRPLRDDYTGLQPVQLYNMKSDIGETSNVQAENSEVVARLTKLLEKHVAEGRSTPGARQANAVEIDLWKQAANVGAAKKKKPQAAK